LKKERQRCGVMQLKELDGLDLSNITKRDIEDLINKKNNSNFDIVISTDGASRGNPGLACGTFAIWENGNLEYSKVTRHDNMTNNLSEMTTILEALTYLSTSKYNKDNLNVRFINDSELCIFQITGKYKVKNYDLFNVWNDINLILNKLKCNITFNAVPRKTKEVAFCDMQNNVFLDNL
jgi:ribonuclease HI